MLLSLLLLLLTFKFEHGAVKHLIATSIFEEKCVYISGPHRGGKHDLAIHREELKGVIKDGKKVIADRGFRSSKLSERGLATPFALDSKELNQFKARS